VDVRPHAQEADRLASLASYRVLDTEPDDAFDALTRLAAAICQVPTSLISLVDADRQWFLGRHGTDATQTARSDSVCSDVVAAADALVVGDLTSTPRYSELAAQNGLAAYAGVPLIGRDGLPLGALCVLDSTPRTFTPGQLSALSDLAAQAVTALELRRYDLSSGLNSEALVAEARLPVVLRAALDNGEFIPHFQPITDMRDGTVRGLEALVRWAHPTLGLLTPAAFLPGLETGTLLGATGRVMLEAACTLMAELQARGLALSHGVAINLTGRQLTKTGVAVTAPATLARYGLPGGALTVEITETAEITDVTLARGELQTLLDAGVHVVADDFGVGWSNLTRLLQLPLSGLKIDRELVIGLVGDPVREHMVASAIALGAAMGLDVVAEGVETEAVRDRLLELGCHHGQGWLYNKAIPGADVPALLERSGVEPSASCNRGPDSGKAATGEDGGTLQTGDTLRVLLDSTRMLLRMDSAEQAVGVLMQAVTELGGSTVPAARAPADALPIDISLGEADPVLPLAPPGSAARRNLERLLPALVEDARTAADRAGCLSRLSGQVDTDPLTGLGNRRGLSRRRAAVLGHDSVAMLDLDHFKQVNDTAGHEGGDRVLVAFSRALRQHLRSTDLVYRLGGEEFLVVMAGTPPETVLTALEHLRRMWEAERPLPVTFSAGVAAVDQGDLDGAMLAADAALYAAKQAGRNRFILAGTSTSTSTSTSALPHPRPLARADSQARL